MNYSFTKYLNSKPIITCIAMILIAWASLRVAPWVSSHIHLTSLQSQLTDLNHKILSNSQRRQELDTKISNLRKEQSELAADSKSLRTKRDALESQIAEQMGLWTGGSTTLLTTTWSEVAK